MPLNLISLTTEAGTKVHVGLAQIVSVSPRAEGGSLIALANGEKVKVRDNDVVLLKQANTKTPDGF